jgi:hypothetical protein
VENKKRAERCRALDQRKREAAATEERQRAAEQLQLLQTEAKAATGASAASTGSSGSSVTRPLPSQSTAPPSAPFGYPPGVYAMMVPAEQFLYPPWDGSPMVDEFMTRPSPSSIDLNRAPTAHSKAPRPMPAPCSKNCRVSVRRHLCRQRPRCRPLLLTRRRCRPPWHLRRPSNLPHQLPLTYRSITLAMPAP